METIKTWLTTIAMLLCSLAVSAHDFSVGGIYYNITSSTDLTVEVTYQGSNYSDYNEYIGSVTIPETVTYNSSAYRVTSIGTNAFRDCESLSSIAIPEGVTTIGNMAFSGCYGISSINLPETVTSFSHSSFSNYNGELIVNSDIPSASSSSYGAFYACSFTKVTIGAKVTKIGKYAFYGCSNLISITIPESVSLIEDFAFYNCSSLSSITIPKSVISIGNYVFNGCTALKEVTFEDGFLNLSLGYSDYDSSAGGLFYYCPLEKIYIGRNLNYSSSSYYGYSPFFNKKTITSITIGDEVTSIGDNAFMSCENLASVVISESVKSIGSCAFRDCSNLTSITIPANVTSIGSYAFQYCSDLYQVVNYSSLTINSTYYIYAPHIFNMRDYENVNGFLFKTVDGVHFLYGYIYDDVDVVLPESYNGETYQIADKAFSYSSLTTISIPESVTSIGNYVFEGCSNLQRVVNYSDLAISKGSYDYGWIGYYAAQVINMKDCDTIDDFLFETVDDIHYLKHYIGNDTNIVLPESYWGEDYRIDACAFYNSNRITSISIPNSVVAIEDYYVFKGCTSLKKLIFKDGNTPLSLGCSYYDDDIRQALFCDCPLEEVYLGRSLNYQTRNYYESPFYNQKALESVTIGKEVTSIENSAFSRCGLVSITIPQNVTSIGNYAFNGCTSLKEIIFEDGNEVLSLGYAYHDGDQYNGENGQGLFYDCPLEFIHLGRTLSYDTSNEYGYSPFYNIASITSVTIGDKVTSIGGYALGSCDNLTSLIIGSGVINIDDSAFSGCTGLTSVVIPDSVTSIGEYAFYNCFGLTSFVIGRNVTSIGDYAFYGCSGLTSVEIPDSVTSIGGYAFYNCKGMASLIIGSGLSSIATYTFSNCSGLTSLTVGRGVISIGAYAFSGCNKLTSITIPECVTSIGNYVFKGCSSLKEVVFEDGKESLALGYNNRYSSSSSPAQGLFYDCPLEIIYLGRTLSYDTSGYGDYSPFCSKTSITSVTIGDCVTSIGSYAFNYCREITSLTLGNSVVSINDGAFLGCNKISSVVIPNSVTSIGYEAFYECSGLTSVLIGNGVTSIGNYTFKGCTALTELTIGSSVSSIGSNAFAGCNDIESIYALNTKAITCEESIFSTDTYNNATLYVPEGREQAYAKATPWSKFYIQTITEPTESYDVKIGSAGYATLYLDYAVERPRGVEAYYISHVAGNAAIMKALWDYIPANTGVILRGAKGTYTFTSTTEDVEAVSENLLRGTTVDMEIRAQSNTTYYALGRVDGVVGLYRAELDNGYFFNNANKAYLALTSEEEEDDDEGQLARSFILRFPDGTATSMAEVMSSDENDEEVIYDLQGRRLTEITAPGLYIINGKKVWR